MLVALAKTPLSIFLAKQLSELGKSPVIIKKFYKEHFDEHNLIKEQFGNFILCKKRLDGLKEVMKMNYDSVILDDGFQDYRIKKDLSIICFNQNQLIGNGLIFPAGPLRETLNSLKQAHIILINGKKDSKFEEIILKKNKNLKIFYSNYKPKNIEDFKNKKLMAVAGIGNPDNFFDLLKCSGLRVEKELVYPDHYQFSKEEVENILKQADNENLNIVMTEKDYFKIKHYKIRDIGVFAVSLEINDRVNFIKSIQEVYDKKN